MYGFSEKRNCEEKSRYQIDRANDASFVFRNIPQECMEKWKKGEQNVKRDSVAISIAASELETEPSLDLKEAKKSVLSFFFALDRDSWWGDF